MVGKSKSLSSVVRGVVIDVHADMCSIAHSVCGGNVLVSYEGDK